MGTRSGFQSNCRSIVVCGSYAPSGPTSDRSKRLASRTCDPLVSQSCQFSKGGIRTRIATYDLCFGYFNLNTEETIDLPLGPDNFIEPSRFDGGQPTHFEHVSGEQYPQYQIRRPHCVFTVTVPEDFGNERVVWTLRVRDRTYSVPGHLSSGDYVLDEPDVRATGRTAPVLRFEPDGPEGRGRHGPGPWGGFTGNPMTVGRG